MKFTTGTKLGLGFGVILTLMVFSSGMAYLKSSEIKQSQDRALDIRFPTVAALKDLRAGLNMTQNKGRQVILAGTDSARKEAGKEAFDKAWDDTNKAVAALDALALKWTLQANHDHLEDAKKQMTALRAAQEEAMAIASGSEHDAVNKAGIDFADKATKANDALGVSLVSMRESFDKLIEENREELKADNRSLLVTMSVSTFAALVIGIIVAFFIIRDITAAANREKLAADEVAKGAERERLAAAELTQKVDSILTVVSAAGQGDLTREIQVHGSDAIGQMGEGLAKFFTDLRRSIGSIGASAMTLASASEELTTVSQQMSANAEETSAQTKVVSGATVQVNQNLQTVATGAEEMGASIKEIAKNATEAAKVASSAVRAAEAANTTVSKLGDSSAEIGQVIKVITSIAQQTNLLALNATIEAARAGEAGKGFAVVANEVKELAKKTAKATEDISRKIEIIQVDAKAAVDSIGTISEVINQINGISNTIATAVEEQNATTNEMARNVSEAAHGSGEITSNIAGVAEAAESTSRGASDTQKAAQQLVETSTELRRLVEQFKIDDGENGQKNAAADQASKRAHAGS
ncbi:MAG TPA: methyl-accepting chemotaxis protein [Terriglobales bacterium]|nr:methyl-accepting chemotaxis protein [Terriglobales bacterium]